jgi:starvation-inducible DNA-binding protein
MTLTQPKTPTTIPESDVSTVAGELQAELTELIDLPLKAKQAHWNVVGPNFRAVHLQLDEIVNDLRIWSDTVAERLSTIGVYPDGRTETIARNSSLREMPLGEMKDAATVQIFADYMREFAAKSRDRAGHVAGDPVSQNILQDITAGAEQHQWMLRAQSK